MYYSFPSSHWKCTLQLWICLERICAKCANSSTQTHWSTETCTGSENSPGEKNTPSKILNIWKYLIWSYGLCKHNNNTNNNNSNLDTSVASAALSFVPLRSTLLIKMTLQCFHSCKVDYFPAQQQLRKIRAEHHMLLKCRPLDWP